MSRLRHDLALLLLVLALVAVGVATLAAGRLGIPPAQQPAALRELLDGGGGLVLRRLRGPRLATGIGAGAALGIAGALFQRATTNALVTPDVIGVTAAAGAGAAVATLTGQPVAAGALVGALAAGAILPWVTRTGFREPAPLIVAGIGVAAASTAVTQLTLVWLRQSEALALASALAGSLNARSWSDAAVVWAALLPLGVVALALRTDLDLLTLGDDLAHTLGSRPGRVRTAALLCGIGLTAAAVTAAGPITFVALTAPHLARWATGRPAMGAAGLVGALTVAAADLAVAHVPVLDGLPVGVVTALLGGAFLGVLLLSQLREGKL